MPRKKRDTGDDGANVIAHRIVQQVTANDESEYELAPKPPPANRGKPEKNAAAVALGRLGGKKGGKARAAKLTPEQRTEIARIAAHARWKKKNS